MLLGKNGLSRKRLAMRSTMAARSATSLRYYLWANDGPWRIAHQLHSDLVSGKVVLRQYAGTKQKIVEVFIRKVRGRPVIVEARGGIYCKVWCRANREWCDLVRGADLMVRMAGISSAMTENSSLHILLAPRHECRDWVEGGITAQKRRMPLARDL